MAELVSSGSPRQERSRSSSSVALTTTVVNGTISVRGGAPVLRITYVSGNGLGAVVNGQRFGSTATSAYTATAVVTRTSSRQ
jgi:hypothetical protein